MEDQKKTVHDRFVAYINGICQAARIPRKVYFNTIAAQRAPEWGLTLKKGRWEHDISKSNNDKT